MPDLRWDENGAAEIIVQLKLAAESLEGSAGSLGKGADSNVGRDVEGMLDTLGGSWQRDLKRRAESVMAARTALDKTTANFTAVDTNVTI